MTPPALYRYFPNKYAVLQELGRPLMRAQDYAVFVWMDKGGLESENIEGAVENNRRLQREINAITRKFPGGIWILRALRAVPLLHEVRIQSRDEVAQRLAKAALRPLYPTLTSKRLRGATRLSTELMYCRRNGDGVARSRGADQRRSQLDGLLVSRSARESLHHSDSRFRGLKRVG